MARPSKPAAKEFEAVDLVEVPRAALQEAGQLAWPELREMAASAGWRVLHRSDYLWCSKDHALLREGFGEMRGIPVLLFQNW